MNNEKQPTTWRAAAIGFTWVALVVAAILALVEPVRADHTGSHTFSESGCSGCHPAPEPEYLNGANAANVITYALGQGMNGNFISGSASDVASYIATFLPANNPNNADVDFNFGTPTVTTTTFVLPNLFFGTDYGALSTIATMGTPVNAASVTFTAPNAQKVRSAIVTPPACVAGAAGSFQYRGSGPGGNSSTRTATFTIGNPQSAPVITSGAPPNGQTLVPYAGHDVNVARCNGIATFSVVSGSLPPGLTISSTTGVVSGTPTAQGTFNFSFRAQYPGGLAATQPASITITLGPPTVTSGPNAANGAVGVANASFYTITANNSPTSFSIDPATPLPPGLSLVGNVISGTPTDASGSPYTVNVRATNGTGTSANRPVTFRIVPAINSAPTAAGQTGVPFSYQITESAGPPFTTHAALDPLPPGLNLAAGSGLISGTPTALGTTNVRLTGSNADGTSAQFTLQIDITLGPPVINSPLAAAAGTTLPFNYQITATNPPHTAFAASPLPPNLSIDTTTGVISGTPQPGTGGVHNVNISATNATGTSAPTVLVLTVSENPPVITSPLTASGQTGSPLGYTITATNGVTSYSATGLPPGLAINTATGVISGTPTAVGVFNTQITATNGSGSDTETLVITITLGPPVITSPATAGGADGFAFSYQITATNPPHTSFGATGLPPGLSVNTGTGLISGTPTVSGTFNATISATNATATATQPLTITLGIGIPVIDSPAVASGATGVAFAYQITATNGPTSFGASGLPGGLSVDAATGIISGVPTAAGSFNVNLSATNGTGTGTRALPLTINLRQPTVPIGPGPIMGINGVPFSYTISATNNATAFSATGLPPGLSLDPNSGIISGTPTQSGAFDATVNVSNAAGTTTFTLHFIIQMRVPAAEGATVEVPYETATPIALAIDGEQYTVQVVSLPSHGLVSVAPGSNIATYTPAVGYVGPDSFRYTVTNAAGTSPEATVDINVVPVPPTGTTALFTVQLNTPTALDLASLIKGSGLTGVSVHTPPTYGTAAVNGLQVTYTPRTDYFGSDSFRYVAYGSLGQSNPVVINIEVVGRPDPTLDRDVVGLVEAQAQAARRFAGTQVSNIQRRLEALHRSEPETGKPQAPPAAPAATSRREAPEPVHVASAAGVASAPGVTSPTARDVGPPSMVATLAQAVSSRTLNLNGASEQGAGRTSFWMSGNAWFGELQGDGQRAGSRFNTDGITVGADRRFGMRWAGGLAAGFAREDTKVGSDGTISKARAASLAGYASFQAGPRTFIDMLVGYGHLDFDSDRHVTALGQLASANRKGRQVFGSVAAAYEMRYGAMLVSPYGRIDFSADRLDATTESGVGNYALRFDEQDQRSTQAVAGLRVESRHETDFGHAEPRARVEYRRELSGMSSVNLWYADLPGQTYTITPTGTSRNALLLGVGTDLIFRGGLKIGLDYMAQRGTGQSNTQGIRVMLTQDLDALASAAWRHEPLLFRTPVNVDFSTTYDDNVNRAREPGQRLEDTVFGFSANASRAWPVAANMRVQATALFSGEKFYRYSGLGRFAGGGQLELQYRTSGAFDATTFAVSGRALYEQYESYYRTGPRYFAGFNARRALTDRIELFGEIGVNWRRGHSEVFNWREYAAKLNLDYALGRKGILYLTGELRQGDSVSSGPPSLAVGMADVFVPDDAFGDLGYIAYRIDSRTLIGTLGLNYPLGARDSVDLSWRRVEGKARRAPAVDIGPLRYIDNQYSLMYLMRF